MNDDFPSEFTLKKDITMPVVVDEKGNAAGDTEFKKGDKFTYYRNDGESIVDLKTSDGRIVRLELTNEDSFTPNLYNGENVEDIFDGVMYAG